jgi:hypothetical protein
VKITEHVILSPALTKGLQQTDWSAAVENKSNRSQIWTRDVRSKVIKVLDELILLAHKLPNDKQEEVFNENTIARLVGAILFPRDSDLDHYEMDSRRAKIASTLVHEGLTKLASQYGSTIQKRQELNEDLLAGLEKTKRVCNAIALEVQSKQLENHEASIKPSKLYYLFNWDDLCENIDIRLKEYLKRQLNTKWIQNATVRRLDDMTTVIEPRENDNCASITLVLSDEKSGVKMTLSDVDGFERETKHLVVKKRDNELLVYERKKSLDYNTIPAVTSSNIK